MLSTMTAKSFDVTNHARIAELGQEVLSGKKLCREDGLWLFGLKPVS